MRRLLAAALGGVLALACGEINAPIRSGAYEWRLFVAQPGEVVDTLAFAWTPAQLPVKIWVADTLEYPARLERAIGQWKAQFLYGEFDAVVVADSNAADVIVRAEDAPPEGPIISLRLHRRARECEGATDVAVDLDTRQVRLPMRLYLVPEVETDAAALDACLDVTMAHELGHVLGIFAHSPEATDLMAADPSAPAPTERDRATAERAYHSDRTLTVVPR
jgi:predicted Zn-dependent protease